LSYGTTFYLSANLDQQLALSVILLSFGLKVKQKSPLLRVGFSKMVEGDF